VTRTNWVMDPVRFFDTEAEARAAAPAEWHHVFNRSLIARGRYWHHADEGFNRDRQIVAEQSKWKDCVY
jgi:hypothetical protein